MAAGADAIFAEALPDAAMYRRFAEALPRTPLLANMTEFGRTPLYGAQELGDAGVSLVLYPLSAFRAQARAREARLQRRSRPRLGLPVASRLLAPSPPPPPIVVVFPYPSPGPLRTCTKRFWRTGIKRRFCL